MNVQQRLMGLLEELSIASDREEAEARRNEDFIQEVFLFQGTSYPKDKIVNRWATFYI